ncbi:hypothetical protein OUZ56_029758 [Daphnia magna]|uniref:Ankyrin repeat domain-containing protein n=1 Tax=Daphnia magna TaxID=35525 RepID=A0ABR0B7R6_9CRUS|nr:hypothetical protein OUZ56_029758 [Daphnia magna]
MKGYRPICLLKKLASMTVEEFGDKIKFEISKMHEQYKISIETEHENKLAKEIRDVYCQLSTIKKTQAVILAQSNGILAASTLGLPICTRLQGFRQAITLQQCETKRIFISAIESKCEFQPFFTFEDKNCTIAVDGWSIHPYSDCFWKTHLVNLNGFHHTWEHNSTDGEWVKQKASIHMPNLDLITEFEELHFNDFDYSLKSHPAHETMEMEQLNILNDLVGLMQESNSKSVSDIVIIMEKIRQTRRLRRYGINMEEAHELTSMIANSNIYPPEEIIEQPFTRMTVPTPLTIKRPSPSRPAQPSAPKQRSIYPIVEENWESDQARKCTGKPTTCTYVVGYGMVWEDLCRCSTECLNSHQTIKCEVKMEVFNVVKKNNEETLVMEQNSEDAVQHNEASDSESQPETNYIVIESDIETESETQRDGLFGDYGFYPPTFKFNPNATPKATLPKRSNCAMKTHPTLSAARADAIQKRTQAITRLRDQEIFLEMIDAPREEIRRCIMQKLGPAAWDYHPKAEFLNQKFNNKTLLHTSVKAGKLDITDLLLDYGTDPDIEEDGQTIAHRAAAENNKLLIRILRYHKYKFSSYNSLGETPLMVAIAYGHEEVASYLWISSNVAQMAKDNSTILHYAAKHGNNTLVRAACERKIHINIYQTTRPGNYTALHLATMYRQDHIVNILFENGAYPNITDVNGNTPRDNAFDKNCPVSVTRIEKSQPPFLQNK